MYINTTTQAYPVSESQIRAENPNTSFGTPFLAPEGYALVFPAPAQFDPVTQFAVEAAPVLTSKGHWEQQWTITDKTAEQIAAEAEARRKAAIPTAVSPRQIRQALTRAGLRTAVESAIAAGDQDVKDWYEFATAFERNHPMVAGLATGLGVTEQQLDDLWTLAGTL